MKLLSWLRQGGVLIFIFPIAIFIIFGTMNKSFASGIVNSESTGYPESSIAIFILNNEKQAKLNFSVINLANMFFSQGFTTENTYRSHLARFNWFNICTWLSDSRKGLANNARKNINSYTNYSAFSVSNIGGINARSNGFTFLKWKADSYTSDLESWSVAGDKFLSGEVYRLLRKASLFTGGIKQLFVRAYQAASEPSNIIGSDTSNDGGNDSCVIKNPGNYISNKNQEAHPIILLVVMIAVAVITAVSLR